MHGRVTLATLAAALLFAAPASADAALREPRRQPGRRGRRRAPATARRRSPLPGWTVEPAAHRRRLRRARRSRPTEDGDATGRRRELLRGRAGRRRQHGVAGDRRQSARRAEIDAGGVTGDAVGADRRLREPGGQGDGLGAAARRRRGGDRPADGAPGRHGRPSARASRTCSRARRPVAIPLDTRKILVTITATRTAGQYNDGYVDNVSFSLRRAAGGGQERRRAAGLSGTVLVKVRAGKFVSLDAVGAQERRRGRRAQGQGRDHPRRRRQGDLLRRHLQALPVRRDHDADPERDARLLQAGAGGGRQAQDAQAVGRRQGQVPHQGQVQRGDRPRHQVARPGHVHVDQDLVRRAA